MSDNSLPLETRLGELARASVALSRTGWRDRASALGTVGARFLDDGDPLRGRALAEMPADSGLSREQCARVLLEMARDWTAPRLEALVRAEFEDPAVLDGWTDDRRVPSGRRLRALPLEPGVGLHICAGTVPGVSVTSLIRGLLVGSPVLLKPGAGDRTLPGLFIEGLGELARTEGVAQTLSRACAEFYWQGGIDPIEEAALTGAGFVVVYGSTNTIAHVRQRTPPQTPVVSYGHKIGLAIVGAVDPVGAADPGVMSDPGVASDPRVASDLAEAVAAFDQRGCVSPHQVFVVGSALAARRLAEAIAARLAVLHDRLPPGAPTEGVASAVHQLRGTAELREAAGEPVQTWAGPGVSWTVIFDDAAELRPSCGARTVHVTPVAAPADLASILEPAGPFLQTVGLAGFGDDQHDALADLVGRLGASRVVPLDQIAYPPAWWIHDGQGPLRRLVRWVEAGPTPGRAAAPPAR